MLAKKGTNAFLSAKLSSRDIPMTKHYHISLAVPLSHPTTMFTEMSLMTLYDSDKLFWLVSVD